MLPESFIVKFPKLAQLQPDVFSYLTSELIILYFHFPVIRNQNLKRV